MKHTEITAVQRVTDYTLYKKKLNEKDLTVTVNAINKHQGRADFSVKSVTPVTAHSTEYNSAFNNEAASYSLHIMSSCPKPPKKCFPRKTWQ